MAERLFLSTVDLPLSLHLLSINEPYQKWKYRENGAIKILSLLKNSIFSFEDVNMTSKMFRL